MNRLLANLSQALLGLLAVLPSACLAAAGDVSFRAAHKTIDLNPADPTFAIDVFFDIEGIMNVPATGWGMIVNITPEADATGTVQFNPPTIVDNEPNLMPSVQNPFLDFDRDFGGMSYGMLGESATELRVFSYYVAPVLGPAPSLDPNGNLSLPDGSGLVALPLIASADASGRFIVTFDPDTIVTGATFATGMPPPGDVGVHPVGTHSAGILSVLNPAGDYNRNGIVDAADYAVWRNTVGQVGTGLPADGNGNGAIDGVDYVVWRAHFGQTAGGGAGASAGSSTTPVPEPTTLDLLIVGMVAICYRRRAAVS